VGGARDTIQTLLVGGAKGHYPDITCGRGAGHYPDTTCGRGAGHYYLWEVLAIIQTLLVGRVQRIVQTLLVEGCSQNSCRPAGCYSMLLIIIRTFILMCGAHAL
jgi:hypothetical protein